MLRLAMLVYCLFCLCINVWGMYVCRPPLTQHTHSHSQHKCRAHTVTQTRTDCQCFHSNCIRFQSYTAHTYAHRGSQHHQFATILYKHTCWWMKTLAQDSSSHAPPTTHTHTHTNTNTSRRCTFAWIVLLPWQGGNDGDDDDDDGGTSVVRLFCLYVSTYFGACAMPLFDSGILRSVDCRVSFHSV